MRSRVSGATLVVCLAALVATAVFGVGYVQQRPVREALSTELAGARQTLEGLGDMSNEQRAAEDRRLQEELAVAEAELGSEERALAEAEWMLDQAYRDDMLSTGGVLKGVFQIAAENRVEILAVSADSEGLERRGDRLFATLALDLTVSGRLAGVAAFVNELERGPVKAVTIENIAVTGEGSVHIADLELSVLYPESSEAG
jgi:hypothetical protein